MRSSSPPRAPKRSRSTRQVSPRMRARKATRSRTVTRQPSCQSWTPKTLDPQKRWSVVLCPSAPRGGSKLARVIALLERDHGATIEELIAATGWLAHTTRAALTGLRKRGYAVAIDRSDDKRGSFYRIPAGETGLVEGPANCETARRKEQGRSEPQAHQAA
jgi:Protein of unknown function (DUF3489)